MHPITVDVQDTQSDVSRASQVAGDLINNTGIDLMMVASTPDTVTPIVEQCEAATGYPVVSSNCPWQTYLGKNNETGYKWSYDCSSAARTGSRRTGPSARRSPATR